MSKREQSNREKALRKYFKAPIGGHKYLLYLVLMVVGIMLIIFSLQANREFSEMVAVIGLALFALGFGKGSLAFMGRAPSDGQIDKWLEEGINRLKKESLTKLSLTEDELRAEEGPLVIQGPIAWLTNGVADEDLLWKIGKDKIVRFGVYRVTIIQLTENLLGAYSCDYNFIRDVALNEETDEYHYRDIVAVSTKEEASSYTLPTGTKLTSVQAFRISVTSGESIEVVVDADKLSETIGSNKMPETGEEKAVTVIRAMLRDKKK